MTLDNYSSQFNESQLTAPFPTNLIKILILNIRNIYDVNTFSKIIV